MPTKTGMDTKLAIGVFVRAAFVSLGGALVGNGLLTEEQAKSLTGASDVIAGLVVIALTIAQSLWSKWRASKAAKTPGATAAAVLCILSAGLMLGSGCVARKVSSPMGYEGSNGEVATIGNYSQWTLGFLAKEAYEDKGVSASFTDGYASNGQTASSDSTASVEMMRAILPPLIQAIAAKSGVPAAPAVVTPEPEPAPEPEVCEVPDEKPAALPAEPATASALSEKIAEAKATGKPLVVIAGNTGCSYCARLDKLIDASATFQNNPDIVLYRETSTWATNKAAKWTGGGAFPVLRVTKWDAAGSIVCDKKINRPQTLSAIEAEYSTCSAK